MTPLTIWTNAMLSEAVLAKLKQATQGHRLLMPLSLQTSNLIPGGPDPQLELASIAFGQPDPQQVIDQPNIKWVHLTSAGYTRYDTKEFRAAIKGRNGMMTNSSSVYEEPCAEHLLAMMLGMARQLQGAWADQQGSRSWPYLPLRASSRLLLGQTAVIYGFGVIARRLVEMLTPFKMTIIAARRKPSGFFGGVNVMNPNQADEWLSKADHVINILPASPETELYFNADRLARIKPGAIYYNIGRGSTVDQVALREQLESGKLSAAYLDVTTPEPLPAGDPLWSAPNCHITPHTAGGYAGEFERLVDHFIENFTRYQQGLELCDRVI